MKIAPEEFVDVHVTYDGPVATVRISPNFRHDNATAAGRYVHWELGETFSRLRGDDDVRVVILTGAEDGAFQVPPLTSVIGSSEGHDARVDPAWTWRVFTGTIRLLETMVQMEKPIIARVNGDAIGFGQSIMFACDLIYAREDARIADMHMGRGEVEPYGPPFCVVPGDGGAVFAPLQMAPALAKEYLMLSREYSARELADRGILNRAVPLAELDAVVDDAVTRLLQRSPYALAWTKRAANKHVMQQLTLVVDAAAGYEALNFYQGPHLGWEDPQSFT
jgi:enoyl-CoA hydratase